MLSYKNWLLMLVMLSSCAHAKSTELVSTTSWLDSFDPSGSFCLDAYMVNSAASGCTQWSTRNIQKIAEIRCVSGQVPENFWTASTFIFFAPMEADQIVPNFEPLCGDMNGVLGRINIE